jgi:hypothetical protein
METSSIILLVVSASISFALGRTVLHFRNKKRKAEDEKSRLRHAQALRDEPPGPPSKNKAKRKRQAQLANNDPKRGLK